ncbi:MAG: hypothetical protein ACYC2Y_02185 [Armatimonadota bacterium]
MKKTLATLAVLIAVSSACSAYGFYQKPKESTLSVFAAVESQTGESGFGVSLDKNDSDIAYLDMGSFTVIQTAKLQSTQVAGFPVKIGFTAAYASEKSGYDAPDGFLTGLTVLLAKGGGDTFSFDLRASVLAKNPINVIGNPDVMWAGAGVSFSY